VVGGFIVILLIKQQVMSLRDFNNACEHTKRELRNEAISYFKYWYTNGVGHFKITDKHRRILEQKLYIID